MYKAWVLVLMFVVGLAILPGRAFCQEQNLMTGDEIIQQLEHKEQPKAKFRAIRIGKADAQPGEPAAPGGAQAEQSMPAEPAPAPSVTFYLYFKTASTELADDFSRRQIQELGKALSSPALAGAKLEIGGHTDSRGTEEYNMQLSMQRANAIKNYLTANYGVNGENLVARGYGESMPAYSNTTEEGMARNRRVVVKRLD